MDRLFLTASDKAAFLGPQGELSYRDFIGQIGRLACRLDIAPGNRVAIYGPNSIAWARALYAIWRKGGVAVPLDFGAGLLDLQFMLQDAQVRVVLTDSAQPGLMAEAIKTITPSPIQVHYDQLQEKTAADSPRTGLPLDSTALILYTSGTTADAKGVELSYRSLLFNIEAVRQSGMVVGSDRLLALFPFHHIVPLQGHILCPLKLEATVCLVEELNSEAVTQAFQSYHITVLNGVPQLYQRILSALMRKIKAGLAGRAAWALAGITPWQKVRKLLFSRVHRHFGGHIKYLLSGGAALPKETAQAFTRLGFLIIEGYGMTEMGPLISFNTPQDNRLGTVGRVIPGVEARIVNEEIQVRGPGLMNGYFRRPDITGQVMADGWLKTGDLGSFDSEGFLTVRGRCSDVLILPSGKNVNAPQIEELLNRCELIQEAGLTVRAGRLFALIHPDMEQVRRQGILNLHEAVKWRLLDGFNRSCSPHQRILDFGLTARPLPRTRLGKLQRHRLGSFIEPRPADPSEANDSGVDPRIIAYLHAEGLTGLHPGAHLTVDLGLDSLALIEFKQHLEQTFRLRLSETVFIEHSILGELSAFLQELETTDRPNPEGLGNGVPKTLYNGGFGGWVRPLIALAGMPFQIRSHGLDRLDHCGRPLIIVSNHQSFLDPLIILRIMPRRLIRDTFFMAKTRIFSSRFGRILLPRLNTVLLDLHQSGEDLLRKCRLLLQQEKNLMIFPEGTRSYDGKLGPFSRAFALLAKETGAMIVPLLIQGAHKLMPRTRLIPRFGKVRLTVLPPLAPPYPDAVSLSDQVFRLYQEQLENNP